MRTRPWWWLVLLVGFGAQAADPGTLVVGSKRFTESYILGEVIAQTAAPHARTEHRQGLGNTAVVLEALKAGAIDVYPEYSGTIDAEILKHPEPTDLATMRRDLEPLGLGVGVPLGFQNTYALAMTAAQAKQLGIKTIGDLAKHPDLVVAVSHEFLGRADGWPGLAARYGLPQKPTGIDHGISYEALASGRIAVTDIYSTDAKIAELGLTVLQDDKQYFPRYDAVLLYRLDLPTRFPAAWRALQGLEGRIDADRMIRMNGDAELRGRAFADIARDFVKPSSGGGAARVGWWQRLIADDLARLTREHLTLVAVSVLAAVLIGVPLGTAAAAWPRVEQPVMALVGVLQTVPSLALFAMLIPLLGRIGTMPALVALTLYALLPVVRNVTTGLQQVPDGLRDAARALAFTPWQRWWLIELPLAMPVVVAGIKTAAVITVGTATIAAFIGAGGYGERIATGLALNDNATLLAGALPAAALALVTQGVFEWIERRLLRRWPRATSR
ncbi:MAG TPA: glycine betaine ABC transporter substrate-binding protein [Burkholderiaceae bacterium]|nr:glycine betaine ABC transporter substrate-binding protein [Burkholderiaceae bacterium]